MQARQWVIRDRHDVAVEPFDFDPRDLAPRQFAARTICTMVSPGTECANYDAVDPVVYQPGAWCAYPWTPGYAGVSEVLEVGEQCEGANVGDRVVCSAAHVSHHRVNCGSVWVPLQEDVSPCEAATVPLLSIAETAYQVLRPERMDPFQSVGVWGLGVIGNAAAQIGQALGYRVVGLDPDPDRRSLAHRCGLHHTLDPTDPDFAEALQQTLDGDPLDIAIDAVGKAEVTVGIPSHVRCGGQIVLLTHWRNQPIPDASALINTIFSKWQLLLGAPNKGPGRESWGHWHNLQRRKWNKLQRQIAQGRICVTPWFDRVTPDDCSHVYDRLLARQGPTLTSAVIWRDPEQTNQADRAANADRAEVSTR